MKKCEKIKKLKKIKMNIFILKKNIKLLKIEIIKKTKRN